MSARSSRTHERVLRPLLAANTVLLVCLTLFAYFLFDTSFYTGQETLTETATQHLMERECKVAADYLRARMPNDPKQSDTARLNTFRTHFNPENSNFYFFFWKTDPTQSEGRTLILNNYTEDSYSVCVKDYPISSSTDSTQSATDENAAFTRMLPSLSLDAYVRSPLTAHDDFFRVQQYVRILSRLKYPVLFLFLLVAVFEGRLWLSLCTQASRGTASTALRELDEAPFYLLLLFWLLSAVNILLLLREQLRMIYFRATFVTSGDVRPAVYSTLLLLFLLSFLTTLPVTSLCRRLSGPKWYQRSVLYRAVSTPNIEQRMQMWLTLAVTLEFTVFLVLFLGFSIENGQLFVLIDAVFTAVILLIAAVQARSTSAYMQATHRIALDGHGTVPTGELRGKSLEHVENINLLSQSAGEQMQLRFINEAFGTKLIRSVSQSLRDPLTAVTAEAERLQSGTLTGQQQRESVAHINDLSQELKQSIEDLLRIANASAEGNEPQYVPTDSTMMLAQAVGEFYDLFRQKGIELVRQSPETSLTVMADGAYMWTVFESILHEFLLSAVPGTRVFLQAQPDGDKVRLSVRGTVREDALPERRSLSLPTAKIFTEKQGGLYHDTLEHDTLTVELLFPQTDASPENE